MSHPVLASLISRRKEPAGGHRVISVAELATHNTVKSPWVHIAGRVYDLRRFFDSDGEDALEHPGGAGVLKQHLGKDATEVFAMFHYARGQAVKMAEDMCVGVIGEESSAAPGSGGSGAEVPVVAAAAAAERSGRAGPLKARLGPDPVLISRKEVGALYEILAAVTAALKLLRVDYIVTGGSLLGAVRQHSILFCDDDIDIAIVERDGGSAAYDRVQSNMGALLGPAFKYTVRPWEGGDKVRLHRMASVFLDIFSIRRYADRAELIEVVGVKKNGQPQSMEYIEGVVGAIEKSAFSQGMDAVELWPCWHFSTRKAVELWPREVYRKGEMFPLCSDLKFGPLVGVKGPRTPVLLLRRAFGEDCFECFYQSRRHTGSEGGTWEDSVKLPLEDEHYVPMQPMLKKERRATLHGRAQLVAYLDEQSQIEVAAMGIGAPAEQTEKVTTTTTTTTTNTHWFGAAIAAATDGAATLPSTPFPAPLREIIDEHCSKATARRAEALSAISEATGAAKYDAVLEKFHASALAAEGEFSFDVTDTDLRAAFLRSGGLDPDTDLATLHEGGSFAKLALFSSLMQQPQPCVLDSGCFQVAFDRFVRNVCCPRMASLYDCEGEIYYQAFPCIRIVQPDEFSIGPHSDVMYGHHPLSINFYVPLTTIGGTSALYLESEPGREDWHAIEGEYGEIVKHFAGAMCAHWTTENKTNLTRVSLDFRLIAGPLYRGLKCGGLSRGGQKDVFRATAGYYSRAVCCSSEEGGEGVAWEREGPLLKPDARVGFPWSVKNWSKYMRKEGAKATSDK